MPPPEPIAIPKPVPPGFSLGAAGRDAIVIRHRRTGMGCMNAFLLVWLAAWTAGCIVFFWIQPENIRWESGSPPPPWAAAIFWAFDIIVALIAVHLFFCRKSFRIDRDRLVIETRLLGLRWTRTLARAALRRFVQIKDGGEGEDSFPSWALRAEGERNTTLLARQPYACSQWLGQTLARWSGGEYVPAPPP